MGTLEILATAAALAGSPESAKEADPFRQEAEEIRTEIVEGLTAETLTAAELTREQAEAMATATAWGNFLTKELGIKMDKNTEETIQAYFGALPEVVQKDVETLLKENKKLFFDLENTMYGLDILTRLISKERLRDKNWTYIATVILENENYLHDEENLDNIDALTKVRWNTLGNRAEVAMAVFEIHYEKEQDPTKKQELRTNIDKLKEQDKWLQNLRERFKTSKEAAFAATIRVYDIYKRDSDQAAEKALFEMIDELNKLDPEDITPEIKIIMTEIEQVKKEKK